MIEDRVPESKDFFTFTDTPGDILQIKVARFVEAYPSKTCEILSGENDIQTPPFPVAWVVLTPEGFPQSRSRTIRINPSIDLLTVFHDPSLIPDGMRYINLTETGIKNMFSHVTPLTGDPPREGSNLAGINENEIYNFDSEAPFRILGTDLALEVGIASALAASAQQGEREIRYLLEDLLDQEIEKEKQYVFVRLIDHGCAVVPYKEVQPFVSDNMSWPLYDAEVNARILIIDNALANTPKRDRKIKGWILEGDNGRFLPAEFPIRAIGRVSDEVFFRAEGMKVREESLDDLPCGVLFYLDDITPDQINVVEPYDDRSLLPFWNQVFADYHIRGINKLADRIIQNNMYPGSKAWKIKETRFPDVGTEEYLPFYEYIVSQAVLTACTGEVLPGRDIYCVRNEGGEFEFLESPYVNPAIFFRPRAFIRVNDNNNGSPPNIYHGTGCFYWRDSEPRGFDAWTNYPTYINPNDQYQLNGMALAARTKRQDMKVVICTPDGEEVVTTQPVFWPIGQNVAKAARI